MRRRLNNVVLAYNKNCRVIDRDKDGFVSVGELRDFLTRLGDKMSEEEVTAMIRIVDSNERGILSCKG